MVIIIIATVPIIIVMHNDVACMIVTSDQYEAMYAATVATLHNNIKTKRLNT